MSGVAHVTGDAMAVHRQHEEGSTSSSMSISTTEPTATIDCSRKRIHSETVDSDVDESTKNIPTTLDRFPKYVDCQETLVEMSFIKWLAGFRLECRKLSWPINTELYFGLFNFFCLNIVPEMVDCRNKINKSTLLKSYVEQSMLFFRGYYKSIQRDKGDTLDVLYYDRMSSMLAYYIDLKLMSSQRYKENSSHKRTSSKINTMLFVFLDKKLDYMFDSIFQLYYVFYGSVSINLGSIMLPVFKKLLGEHPMPKKINFLTYMRYILCFKLWKKIIHSSPGMAGSVKRKELENLRLLLRGLNVPNDFMSQHGNYNWPNWPKMTISSNGTPDSIQRDLKNVSFVLYGANLSLKECYKDILDTSRKDIPILLKPIEEQCKTLRPDLFAISGTEVLRNWNEDFDKNLKPLIPTTRSCNSLLRKIKYNLYIPSKYECLEIDDETDEVRVVPINDDLSKLKHLGEGSENHSVRNIENSSNSDKKCMEQTNLISSSTNETIDESNNDKSDKNDKSSVDALKSLMATHESCPADVKSQSNEDEMQVNEKKSKSSEKHVLYGDESRFDPTSSNNPSILNYISESTSTSHHPECSYSKGPKRNQCSSFGENSKSKKVCRTKSKHEKNVSNCSSNQIIDSNCQNSNVENSSCVTLNNDNSVLETPKNSKNINGVPHLMNESSVKENKWVTKASHPELSITAVLNLKHTQSNFTVSDKDEGIENCTKMIDLSSDQDGTASPSSDIQWPIKLSHSDPYSPEPKRTIDNSEQMEIEPTSSDTEGNNSPKTEHSLSLRNSEEMISKLASSRRSINENENTQIYALPMDQKLSHVEHPYVENAINSNTRDLEVVNVLSPVSINSTDIPMNKSSWVPDISLVHAHNDHNDIDCDHSQSSLQQLNGLCNSININTSLVTNRNSEVELLNNMQLETPTISRPCSYNRIESRIFPEDSYTAALSPSESSVSNSAYGSAYDVNRIPMAVTVKPIPVTVSSKDVAHELNDSNSSIYHSSSINMCFNGLKKKSIIDQQPSYNFAMNKSRPTEMNIMERGSSSNKDKHDVIDVVSDDFSDVDSMDLRINSAEPKDNNLNINNLSMSSLISTDLKSINTLNSFEKCGNWSTIKNPSDTTNHHQKQKLKIYTDPTEMISVPISLNAQSVIPINLNEAHVQKVFLGNKSPPQVYYSPITDFRVSSDLDMTNHGNIEDPNLIHFKNTQRNCVNICSNDKYIHPMLQSTDNDPNVKQTLINGYDGVLNQNPSIMNNGLMYKYPRSDSNTSIRYENPPLRLQHKNPERISPHNGLQYSSYDQILGPSLLEDPNQKEEQSIMNMTHLMLQPSKNCKVHYKWPLNKTKSQTSTNGKLLEVSQSQDYKRNSNILYKYTDDELNQKLSPNEIPNQSTGLSFNDRINNSTLIQPNQQFQDLSNFIAPDHLSPTIQSGSESIDEKTQIQSRAAHSFENNSRTEPTEHQEMYRNTKIPSQSKESSTSLGIDGFEAAHYLFNSGKLFLCMYPKCTNSHHFRVIPSNAEMLRHEFTVPFDDFRFNIQYKYKQLLTSNPRTWPNIPVLEQLTKRCLCDICGDFDSKLNQNQEMLHTYVEGKKPSIEEDNCENEQPTNTQISLSWKKHLAQRFTSAEDVEKQSISQMIDDMERHIKRFKHAFTIIFPLNKDVKINSQNLRNACESYSDSDDSDKSLNSECKKKLEIGHKCFIKDLHLHSYQYLQVPNKVIPKHVLEELSNSSYHPPNQNLLATSHQCDEEHFPNELNRYFVKNSLSPSYQSINLNLTSQSLKYVHENISNPSHQVAAENSPSTSRQSSIGNLTSSSHQPVLSNFPTTSHGISLDSSSTLNDRGLKHNHMSRYYSDGQMYTEFPQAYLQVPSAQFPNSSTNSYYGSPVNMPSDNSVPFCSPSLSINSVPHSPSSDCSIPSLVETVATAVPEHALLDDSLEAVNAAHNLMLISNRHRYNSTTSITTTKTTDTMTVSSTATTNYKTVKNSNIKTTDIKANKMPITDTTVNITPADTTANNISLLDSNKNNISTTCFLSGTIQPSMTEPEDQETDIVHNSRRKKKKKHDKKKDKKKKGKR
ncbi:uncharacterized protein LOC100569878 [Acyrthosiphon pisum]|uniref:Uncharacterized protein n=1 Tax=Acyrthosiphon pisum TaxID=7029 RepID=A0A8R2A5S5_ACYPI|nr:uncharacterized protein LOC100569878 [Acyrthosiphon pisum]|eukprot:XP_003245158.1 PREDICTED: uncharacterized protein LOC100569878 [Acyrthosiphon pisum]